MSGWNISIVALGGHSTMADDVARRLQDGWRGDDVCVTIATSEDFAARPRAADLIILISDRTVTQSGSMGVLDAIDETGVPVIALLDGEPEADNFYAYAGALVDLWSASDDRLVSLVRGLLHREREIKQMKSEASMTQRFHGGLKGQIAKMHEELQLAAMVQREFLPRELPHVHGIEFAAMWRPTNYVSGDIYDLIRLDEDHVGVFIADAVGHGVPAALMTMVICRSLTTKEITGNTYQIINPADVMLRLNAEMIRRQGRTTRFATAVYAVIDCRNRRVQLAGAGHPPPLRLAGDGTSQMLETRGGLLGVFPDETFEQIEFDLALGDRLLFYTDGFEQAFPNAASDAHSRRLPNTKYRSEFDQLRELASATEMIDAISRRIDDQAGSLHQVDDLTMICVHAGPVAADGDAGDRETTDRRPAISQRAGAGLRLAS